jgi:Tfp pilus assembly protein PilN
MPLWPLAQDNQARSAALSQAARQAADAAVVPEPTPVDRRREAQARRLLVQLDAPWNDLFSLLERHASPQVGLLRLDPDAATGQVRLTALAKDLGAMAAWLRALEQDPRLSEVQLLQHQIEDLTPGRPVRFSLSAHWRAGTSANTTAAAPPRGPATDPGRDAAEGLNR